MITLPCDYEGCDLEKFHTYPDDWNLGGANMLDPAADPRWMPTTYTYYDEKYQEIWLSQGPNCDEEAIDLFSFVAGIGPKWDPVYLGVKRPGEEKATMLPVQYDKATDTAKDLVLS